MSLPAIRANLDAMVRRWEFATTNGCLPETEARLWGEIQHLEREYDRARQIPEYAVAERDRRAVERRQGERRQ